METEKYDKNKDAFTFIRKYADEVEKNLQIPKTRTKVKDFIIPPYSGKGFKVKAGQTFKVIQSHGRQICDLIMFNERNKEERSDSCISNVFDSISVQKYSRIWSSTTYNRPIATVVENKVDYSKIPKGYVYHIWAGHCCTEWFEAAYGEKGRNHDSCYMNFLAALLPFGMSEAEARQPNMNLFQPATITHDEQGRLIYRLSPSKTEIGDYIEFCAEIDLIVALSVCPYGDQSTSVLNAKCHPVTVEINDTDLKPKPFGKWHDWRPVYFNILNNKPNT